MYVLSIIYEHLWSFGSIHGSSNDIQKVKVFTVKVVLLKKIIERFCIRSFFKSCLDDKRLIHASIQTTSPPYFRDNVIDTNVMRSFKLRQSSFFDIFEPSGAEKLGEKLLVCLSLNIYDYLISCIVKINANIFEWWLSKSDIRW
jgi:hypothetical protein